MQFNIHIFVLQQAGQLPHSLTLEAFTVQTKQWGFQLILKYREGAAEPQVFTLILPQQIAYKSLYFVLYEPYSFTETSKCLPVLHVSIIRNNNTFVNKSYIHIICQMQASKQAI